MKMHGYNGPLYVSRGGLSSALGDQFIEAAQSLYGREGVVDYQDFKTINKPSSDTGKRSDAAHGYGHPTMTTQDNLNLLVTAKVVRVLFEGRKPVGVECVHKYVPRRDI